MKYFTSFYAIKSCCSVVIKIIYSQNFHSLTVYCHTLFNVPECIYLEENLNLRTRSGIKVNMLKS